MKYKYHPKNKKELIEAIRKEIFKVQGSKSNPNWEADLNCIDTSRITDMSYLFSLQYSLNQFNGDISEWNVSNVEDMDSVFLHSVFNKDISNWDVSSVKSINFMFAYSKFNQDISKWNVSNVEDMGFMFFKSKFNKDISKWDVSNVKTMEAMFKNSSFNKDIGNWDEKLATDSRLNNISANPHSSKLPDKILYERTARRAFELYPELAIVNRTVRRYANKEIVKNLLRKYTDININKRILAKYSELFSIDSFEKRVEWCYNNIDNKKERKQVIAMSIIIPYVEKSKNKTKNEPKISL